MILYNATMSLFSKGFRVIVNDEHPTSNIE